MIRIGALFLAFAATAMAASPSGTYKGSKSVLGQSVDATIVIVDDSHMNLEIEGPISLKCDGEQYTLDASSGAVTLPTAGNGGDCIHDALAAHGGSIKSIKYDSSADSIDVSVTVLNFLNVDITLDHQSTQLRGSSVLMTYAPSDVEASPSGTYSGSKTVLGQTVSATIAIVDDSHMNLDVEGPISLKCSDEQYTLDASSGAVTLPTAGNAGDCIHDALAAHGGSIKSIKYDSSADSIDVSITVLNFLNVDITLTHSGLKVYPVHPERLDQLFEITSTEDLLWRVSVNNRFSSQAPGASKVLCGVKGSWKQAIEDAVARGEVERFEDSEHYLEDANIPTDFDSATNWPNCAKIIGDIRDQSACGCCWAFAGAEAASDRMCIATDGKMMTPISAQDVCFGSNFDGCDGGMIDTPWEYIKSTGAVSGGQYQGTGPFGKGLCQDFSLPHCHHHGPQGNDPYPAEGTTGCPNQSSPRHKTTCDSAATAPHNNFKSDQYTYSGSTQTAGSVSAIQQMIMKGGPVETAFTVYTDFENYAGGIYHHVSGSMAGGHAVKIVGWGEENGVKYWKVANSWNPYWGEEGYFRIRYGEGGIDDQVIGAAHDASWSQDSSIVEEVAASPSGTYKGSKSVLGQTVSGEVDIVDDTHMNLDIEGPISIKCPGEQYTLDASSGAVTLPNAGNAGDCIHDALAAHGGKINSIKYDSSADSIAIDVTVLNFLHVSMDLTHQGGYISVEFI